MHQAAHANPRGRNAWYRDQIIAYDGHGSGTSQICVHFEEKDELAVSVMCSLSPEPA